MEELIVQGNIALAIKTALTEDLFNSLKYKTYSGNTRLSGRTETRRSTAICKT